MEKKRKREGARPSTWLTKHFSLPIRRVRGRGAQRSTPTFATVLTALTIHLFKVESFSFAF